MKAQTDRYNLTFYNQVKYQQYRLGQFNMMSQPIDLG